jgi:hypothetical protein
MQLSTERHGPLVGVAGQVVGIGRRAAELVGQIVVEPASNPGTQCLDGVTAAKADNGLKWHAQTLSAGLAAFFISSTM